MSALARPEDYFPEFGDHTYDVLHYDLRLGYRVETNVLDGRAEIRARAAADLADLRLDLHALKVRKVSIDGVPVAKFSARGGKLVVRPKNAIAAGAEFRVTVRYGGQPRPISDGDGDMGWEELTDGVLVAGQTNGAGSWFPCNDRPSNKATYRIEVTAASAYHVVANGSLVSRSQSAGATSWVYEQVEPMATYLATVQIGRYVAREVPGSPVPMTAILPEGRLRDYESGFGRQAEMMAFFIHRFGAYPFGAYAVVITEDPLEIPLESQGLSVFGSNFLTDDWESVRLVAHELSHQWFGNSLTVTTWRDIWLNEGFACYAEWLWSEEAGGPSADLRAQEHWHKLAAAPQDLVLADPGADDMFDDRVYKRGALFLHSLRCTLGDVAFFDLIRTWVRSNTHGSVTTAMFLDLATEVAGVSLTGLFQDWLHASDLPKLPRVPA